MNDELTILKLFLLLRQTFEYADMFTKLSFSHKNLIKNKEISVFPNGSLGYHILDEGGSVIMIDAKKNHGKIINVSYIKMREFSKLSRIYDEIYAAALEHNFFHEIGKFS